MKTGIFTESAETYHKEREHLSSSPLRKMKKSPLHFFDAWRGPAQDSTDEQEKGTATHSLLLEQDIERYARRPQKEDGTLVRSNSKDYAAWLETVPGKIPVEPEFYDNFYNLLDAFTKNKKAMSILESGEVEKSVYAKDSISGLYIKARPDIWGPGYLADLKSTSNMDLFENQIFALGYDVQAAHYAETVEAATGEKIEEFFFIAVETKSPFASKVFRLSTDHLEDAKRIRRQWITEISACLKDNTWPSYSEEIITVARPNWIDNHAVSFEGVG